MKVSQVATFACGQYTAIFYNDKTAEVWYDGGRSGGVVLSRNFDDPLSQCDHDLQFICLFFEYFKDNYKALDFLMNQGRAKMKRDQYPVWQVVRRCCAIKNRTGYNSYEVTQVLKSEDEAIKALAECANYRPSGKQPILGSGDIYEYILYRNTATNDTVVYERLLYRSYGKCEFVKPYADASLRFAMQLVPAKDIDKKIMKIFYI